MTIAEALPWWDSLPEDYNRQPCATPLDTSAPWRVRGTAALDNVLRTALAAGVTVSLAPTFLQPGRFEQDLEQLAFYKAVAARGNAAEAMPQPPANLTFSHRRPRLLGYAPRGVNAELIGFQSPYQALNPAVRESYARHHRNHQVVAQHWRHPDGPRPTLLFAHGYFVSPRWFNSLFFGLRWFYDQGYDILLYTQPFHGDRRGPREPFNGFGIFGRGFAESNEAMLQSVHDLRVWIGYLEAQGVRNIGVAGMSLGGYVAALAAASDSRLAYAIANVPAVLPIDMAVEWPLLDRLMPAMLGRRGVSLRDMRHALAVHCPLTYAPAVDTDRLLIIGGAGDRFTSPRYLRLLHEHWAGSHLHWFPGNHMLHLGQGEYLRRMKDFMDRHSGLAAQRG
jgi:pimeloyl-ACP methyl ester carboxylesterase